MAKDQDAQFNVSSEVVEGGTSGGSAGGGVPYPDAPADSSGAGALSAFGDAVDLDAMARADRLYSRAGVTFSAPDRPELRNQYGGSITPPWAPPPAPAEVAPAYPDPAPNALTVTPPSAPATQVGTPRAADARFNTFLEYRDAVVDSRTDLANVYTQQGRGGEVGTPAFEQQHRENLVSLGLAQPPPPPEPPGAYAEYRERLTGIEDQTRNEYAEMGMADMVGSPLYRNLIETRAQDAGLTVGAEAPAEIRAAPKPDFAERAVENVQHSFQGYGGLNYAYAGTQLAEGFSRYYEQTNTGRTLTQEQQDTSGAALLPGAAGVTGTVLGAAFGGEMGAWAGGILGQGIGSAAQGVFGANEEIAQSTRQSAERLAAALGDAADKVGQFRDQIEQTGAPAKDLAAVLSSAGAAGNFGAGTVAGVGALTNALGEYAQGDAPVIGRYADSPVNRGIGRDYAAGQLGQSDLDALGFDAAIQGDFDGLKTLQRDAQRAPLAHNQDYQRASKDRTETRNPLTIAEHVVFGGVFDDVPFARRFLNGNRTQEIAESLPADANVPAQNALAETFATIRAEDLVQGPQAQNDAGRLGVLTAQGAGVADVGAAGAAYQSDLAGMKSLNDQRVAALRSTIASPFFQSLTPEKRDFAQQQLAEAETQDTRYDAEAAGARRTTFGYGYGAETAGFGLTETRSELSGASAEDLLGARRRQAAYLETTAADPQNPLSPSERAGIDEQAARLRYSAARDVDTERQGELGVQAGRAGLAVAEARAGGTAGDVAQAQGQQLGAFQAQIAELSQELARGGLTVQDRVQRERELTQVQQEAVQATADRRREYFATTEAQAQDDLTVATVGLSRQTRLGGTASVDAGAVDAPYGRLEAQDRAALAAAPAGSREASDARARLATDTQRQRDVDDTLNVFSPGARTRTELIEGGSSLRLAEGAFRRSQEAPYADGDAESNPFSRGIALEADIGHDVTRVRGVMGQEDQFRAGRIRAGRWDPLAEERYQSDRAQQLGELDQDADRRAGLEHDRVYNAFSALPETISGSPGAGVSAGVLPTAAMSAYFTPGPQFGGYGHTPGDTLPGAGAPVREGGVYGGFSAATGAGETVAVLRQILAALAGGGRPGLVTAPPVNSLGAIVSQQESTHDWTGRRK